MQLSCDEVEPMIGFLLDNELDQAQSEDVEEHLETCEACRAVLEEEGSLRDVLRRAAASVDTPVALRNRLHLTMERERRSQIGLARAWPAAVAAAILVSFVWHGARAPAPRGLEALSQTQTLSAAMDVTSSDPDVIDHYLQTQLTFRVPVASLAAATGPSKPLQLAARVVDKDGRQAAFLRFDFAEGSVTLMVGQKEAKLPEETTGARAAFGAAGASPLVPTPNKALYIAHDANGLTVAQWQTGDLVYDMVSSLPQAGVSASVERLAR